MPNERNPCTLRDGINFQCLLAKVLSIGKGRIHLRVDILVFTKLIQVCDSFFLTRSKMDKHIQSLLRKAKFMHLGVEYIYCVSTV